MESKHVPSMYCRNLIARVREEESIEPADFFAGTAIDVTDLSSDSATTTHSNQILVYERVAALSTHPGFGFRAGATNQFGDHGLLGALLYTAPSVTEAFAKLERYIDVIGGMLRYRMILRGAHVLLACSVNGLVSRPAQQLITEESIAIWKHIALPVGGLEQLTQQIRIDYPRPCHGHLYESLCPGIEFLFNSPRLEIVLPREVLDLPMPGSNPPAFELLEAQCAAILEQISPSFTQRIEHFLTTAPPAQWTQGAVAEHLHCSSRTLRRRLSGEGTSLRSIVDRHRHELAARQLMRGEGVGRVAAACGFESTEAFTRAFRRWTGVTPRAFAPRQG